MVAPNRSACVNNRSTEAVESMMNPRWSSNWSFADLYRDTSAAGIWWSARLSRPELRYTFSESGSQTTFMPKHSS